MPRLHLFEIEDQPWCPTAVRAGGVRYLHVVTNLARTPWRAFASAMARGMAAVEARSVLDLCSGAAGPVPTLLGLLDEHGVAATATLTDRFPDPRVLTTRTTDRIAYHPLPVDAREVPAELGGFRLLCNAFHHFAPDDARQILADAVRHRRGIAVVEMVERRATAVLAAALGLLGVPLALPFFRPLQWEHAVFTYVLPLIPLMTAFDGVVSALRAYTVDELAQLAAEADPDATFEWTIERTPLWGLPIGITWLVGHPRSLSGPVPGCHQARPQIVSAQSRPRTTRGWSSAGRG